tara:strand:+ start:190 stop:384 length:195 start_codon:yes stop_codon:yes gene_type:complete
MLFDVCDMCFKRGQLREYFTLTLHLSANVKWINNVSLPALGNEKKVETTLQLLLAYAFKLVYDF